MKILSIQSAVAYGHVGNSAAVFPLQRIGVEVLPVYTVNFSNHTGYGAWRGPLIDPADVGEVITGIEERGVFGQIDAVLSGYQGGEGIGADVLASRNFDEFEEFELCCQALHYFEIGVHSIVAGVVVATELTGD